MSNLQRPFSQNTTLPWKREKGEKVNSGVTTITEQQGSLLKSLQRDVATEAGCSAPLASARPIAVQRGPAPIRIRRHSNKGMLPLHLIMETSSKEVSKGANSSSIQPTRSEISLCMFGQIYSSFIKYLEQPTSSLRHYFFHFFIVIDLRLYLYTHVYIGSDLKFF